ncbi:hypothetical protein [Brachyspira pilosicoli]|uniref:Lipoprotein n=1 Tax=Brachyspira pilosicoli TaxID=52584 RepID=A0A5C8ET93_BRAPL|nr:hypothetical protein [Brachyspira pilosicoli]TXJ41217.1 hypothetical protein EPJ72_07345 [Brachyspira pilosicoli]
MKKIFLFTLFLLFIFFSCNKNIKPLNKNKEYTVNITYVKDNDIISLNPSDFFYIFNSKLPLLSYNLLGYKIKYVLKEGINAEDFYKNNRKLLNKNIELFKKDYIDIKKTSNSILARNILYYSLSNETYSSLNTLFDYDNSTTSLEELASNIAPTFKQNILTLWNTPLLDRKKLLRDDIVAMYTAQYWRVIGSALKDSKIDSHLIIINMPITANYKGANAKTISEGGVVDRLVLENENIENTKSLAVISTYPFLSNNKLFSSQRGVVKIDSKTLNDIFSYYILQTIAMMFNKYDIHTEEKHSIMSEVEKFNYIDWYNNIVNYELRAPYKGLKYYKDSIKY